MTKEIASEECSTLSEAFVEGYNKAIDDFVNALCSNEVVDKSVVRRCATQLKGSAE